MAFAGRPQRSVGRSALPRRAAARAVGLVLVASLAVLASEWAAAFVAGRARLGASQQLAQRNPAVARRNWWGDESEIKKLDEVEPVDQGGIVKGVLAGSVLSFGTLGFGALAISGAVVPIPVGLVIVAAAVLWAIYASLNGAKQNSGEEVDWVSGKDIKTGQKEVVFAWPWLKKGERAKAGPLSFF
mmetsp:Transcript_36818/g.106134  ORF Transcript_36818/g.106134 Transcript_36818/m.106134 type:complete len:186 (+) Transcript_36818:67-624(+)